MESKYPPSLIVPPQRSHKQTFILHGRGSSASKFGHPLLATFIAGIGTLPDAFPHAKFVFLTASRRRATIYNRSIINQWFDNWSLTEPDERQELQIDGLRESSAFIHEMVRREAGFVGGTGNVVLGGLSQGCAASLVALLLWDGEPLGAVFGMCGWLPFGRGMGDVARGVDDVVEGEDYNPFEDSVDDDGVDEAAVLADEARAVMYLREELDLPVIASTPFGFQGIPIFLGHGKEDENVSVKLGREATLCLRSMGGNVRWEEYEGLGHWYSPEMLLDLVEFVKEHTAWE